MNNIIKLHPSWRSALEQEFSESYMHELQDFLVREEADGKMICPATKNWFAAFNVTPLDRVKVVILGQDPYHGIGQAHGLCFSVLPSVKVPPSLVNMFKELQADLNIPPVNHGCLLSWARQGVLMLNATLTVEQANAGSHQSKGWELFTDKAISEVSRRRNNVVFLLWGGYAQKKAKLIDETKHLILKAPHPSPLSAYRGFFGCGHFSKANEYLSERGRQTIDWRLPSQQQVEKLLQF
jgi:uracil-DNA glycosylase